jgi:Tol biopolymer transport system component
MARAAAYLALGLVTVAVAVANATTGDTNPAEFRPAYDPPRNDYAPSWSPDGRWIAFKRTSSSKDDLTSRVDVVRTDGTVQRKTTGEFHPVKGAGWSISSPIVWNADSSRFAFSATQDSETVYGVNPAAIWIAGPLTQAAEATGWTIDGTYDEVVRVDGPPAWDPAGRRLVFARTVHVERPVKSVALAIFDVSTRSITEIAAEDRGPEYRSPAWSPAGTQIAYGRGGAVYVIGSDGAGNRRVALGSQFHWLSAREIAVLNRDGINAINVDTGASRRMGRAGELSPDGAWLAYTERNAIWVQQLGGAARKLTDGSALLGLMPPDLRRLRDHNPDYLSEAEWSWSGNRVAFSADGPCAHSGIYTINRDGRGLRRLTNNCVLRGTAGADRLAGSIGPDYIHGHSGNDRIHGNPKGATIYGSGRGDNDVILGGHGDDLLDGGRNRDYLDGGPGQDILLGSGGEDELHARDGERDRVSCGGGRLDVAIVDRRDAVAADCEVVRRR